MTPRPAIVRFRPLLRSLLVHLPVCTDAQGSVTLQIGDASADAGGYVQVINPGTEAVDISGRALSGAVQFTFAPGILRDWSGGPPWQLPLEDPLPGFRRVQQHINHRLSTPYNSLSNSSLALRNGHCGGRHAARLGRPGGLPQGQGRAGPVRGGALLRLHPGLGGQRDHRLGPQCEDIAALLAFFATFQPNIDSTLISCLSCLQCRHHLCADWRFGFSVGAPQHCSSPRQFFFTIPGAPYHFMFVHRYHEGHCSEERSEVSYARICSWASDFRCSPAWAGTGTVQDSALTRQLATFMRTCHGMQAAQIQE